MITRKSKFMSAMLSVCMTFSAVPAVYAAGDGSSASDIDGHWAKTALEEFIKDGYLNGDGNGNYNPDGTMTRAQFAAIVNRILNYSSESTDISKYKDVSASAWYKSDMAKALAAAYLSGTSEETMSPEASVTREQAFVIIARILKLDTSDTSALDAYADAADVSDWAKGSVAALIKAGYVTGDDNKKINPKKALTRAEGVTVLNRSKAALDEHKVIVKGVYKDGVYTGTGAGYGGTMKLQVTIKDGKISDIQILSHSETGSYLERAKTLLDKIKANNGTTGVNAVSGATRSSNGIFDAVKACLSQAEGGKDTSTTGSTGGGGGHSGNATKPEDDNSGTISLPDGVYEGTAQGFSRDGVSVKVTFKSGRITNIEVTNVGETPSYFSDAINNNGGTSGKTIVNQIIDKNSTDGIDTVSGATYSSYAIINAVKNAISQGAADNAATYEVSSWAELNNAIAKASDGDIVKLAADITDAGKGAAAAENQKVAGSDVDVVSSATSTVNKSITIDGNGKTISKYDGKVINVATDKEGKVTATLVDPNFCFDITDAKGITIKDLTVDGASFSAKLGGAMYVESGAGLSLSNVTFKNCKAGSTGTGNGGGAIYVEPHRGDAPTLEATDCVFENNIVNDGTTGRGGAVYGYNANIVLTNCQFKGNKAGYGGAVAAAGSSNLTVTGCTFDTDNDGTYGGDDIYIFDGYTFYKKTMATDSAVNYSISGNTYNGSESDWKDYNVVIGRVIGEVSDTTSSDGNTITKTCAGSGNTVFLPGHDLAFGVEDYERKSGAGEAEISDYKTVMMNVPYADFYASELEGNDVDVDAVTSATSRKWKATDGLARGSYNDNGASAEEGSGGGKILGVYMPVLVPADYESDSSLTVNDNYYTTAMLGTPSYYKIMTVGEDGEKSFSKTYGITSELNDVNMTFTTSSRYGDYQLNFAGLPSGITVYGMVVSTADKVTSEDGKTSFENVIDYGMRHLENIWRSGMEVSWSTGFKTEEVHGNTLSYDHYTSMMGKYITEAKFITDQGIYTISAGDEGIYVPVKFNGSLAVENSDINGGTAPVTLTGLPEDYEPVYTITGPDGNVAEGFSCDGKELKWEGTAALGEYSIELTDGSSKYDSLSTSFELTTSVQAAVLNNDELRLVPAEGIDDETFNTFLNNINHVYVVKGDGSDSEQKKRGYETGGRWGTTIVDENGFIDLTANGYEDEEWDTSDVFSGFKAGDQYTLSISATGYADELEVTVTVPKTIYAYASLSYDEYWANEGVYAAGSTESSSEADSRGEYDKGAFDAVTRATKNHGLHRGSFQQTAVIYANDADGNPKGFYLHSWSEDGSTMIFTDGSSAAFSKGILTISDRSGEKTYTVTSYEVTGIKYVPVAVSGDDYADFCKEYTVTKNGAVMAGGYTENNLSAYEYTAYVTSETNGLKEVSRTSDGWSFSARHEGTGSGILGQDDLESCDEELTVKDYSGNYGEFLRADMLENYGGLGAAMQTVRWDYYGSNDPESSEPLASFGTKFAADNWMHKLMGIQLGLTDSLRCKLPEGTDGTGKWVVTIYGLGYSDYTDTIEVTSANLPAPVEAMTEEQKTKLTSLKDQAYDCLKAYVNEDGTIKEGMTLPAEPANAYAALLEHYKEAVEMLADPDATEPEVAELISELPDLIAAVQPKSEETASVSEVLAVVEDAVSDEVETAAESVE